MSRVYAHSSSAIFSSCFTFHYLKHFATPPVEMFIECKNPESFPPLSLRKYSPIQYSRGSRRLTFSLIGQPAFYSSSCTRATRSPRSLVNLSSISVSREGGSVTTVIAEKFI